MASTTSTHRRLPRLSLFLFLFLLHISTWRTIDAKSGYDYGANGGRGGGAHGALYPRGNRNGRLPAYQTQRGVGQRFNGRYDERGQGPPSGYYPPQPGGANNNQPPTHLFMQPRKFPKSGNCAYLAKCTTCQDACPPPPGGCNKPTQVPTPRGENPTDCCPQWKCGVPAKHLPGGGVEIGVTVDGKVCIIGTPGCRRAGIDESGRLCILGEPGCGEIGITDDGRPCMVGTPGCHRAGVDSDGRPCILGTPGCGSGTIVGITVDGKPCILGTPGCGRVGVDDNGLPCLIGTPGCGEVGVDADGKPCKLGTPGCRRIPGGGSTGGDGGGTGIVPGRDYGPEGWDGKGGCIINGKRFQNGDVFNDGCVRKCICKNGYFECNPMCESVVPPINCRNPRQRKEPGECCPTWECDKVFCTFNGKRYEVGEKVDNGCEGQCICAESGMMYCVPFCPQTRVMPSAMCPNPKLISGRNGTSVISPATCCDRWECDFRRIDRTCMYKGTRYQDGESFEDGCDWNCKCYAGKISCSSKCVVSLVPPQNTCTETEHFQEDGECCHHWQCCHKVNMCYDNGRPVPQGETFFKGCDSRCVCTFGGQIHCISRCPPLIDLSPGPECPYPKKIKDEDGCCDVWVCEERSPCTYKGQQYKDEEVFYDGCELRCYCRAGKVHCTQRCPPTLAPPGSDGCKPVRNVPEGECCPVWECQHIPKTCIFQGVQYIEGDRWNDGCDRRCLCMDGRVECMNMCPETHVRPSHSCPNPVKVTKPGKCCPIWECPCDSKCKVNGREREDGDVWTEGCQKKCRCVAGIVDCVSVCPPIQVINSLQCLNPIKHEQGCCPIYECPAPTSAVWPPGSGGGVGGGGGGPGGGGGGGGLIGVGGGTSGGIGQSGSGVTGTNGGRFGITIDLRPCVLGSPNCLPGGYDSHGKPCVLGTVGCRPAGCPPCPNGGQTPKCTYPLQVQRPGMCCPMWKCVQYY